ncbi:MAG: hypothetical protein SAK42_01145 [Oscillatoria sp. PMC 1076.18]|nr:hypothetical protein [Oscillatoria sp. PMC 1076.18]
MDVELKNGDRVREDLVEDIEEINIIHVGEIQTLGTCLEGVTLMMTEIANEDYPSAFITFSAIADDCEKAGTIIEQQQSNSGTSGA